MRKKSSRQAQKRSSTEECDGENNDEKSKPRTTLTRSEETYSDNEDMVCATNDRQGSGGVINDNNNNGLGIARRPSQSPPPPPRPSIPISLSGEEKYGKLKQPSSTDTVSTATGSMTHMSTVTNKSSLKLTPSRSIRAQQRLYNRQLQLLASLSGGSLIIFLLSFLNVFAFTALLLGLSSTSMLFYTIYIYFLHILNGGEGSLFEYLPGSIQNYLTNTSLHEAMTDDSSFLENRWYLLYFIPGLTPEQINSMVERLPHRHREMAHGPGGVARLALPESLFRLIAPPNARDSQRGSAHNTGESGHVMRITDGEAPFALPVIREDEDIVENDTEGQEVTIQDAFQGILNNARNLMPGGNIRDDNSTNAGQPDRANFHDLQWNDDSNEGHLEEHRIEVHVVDDSDSETSDLGLELSADDFTGQMNDGELSRLGRLLRLRQNEESPPFSSRRLTSAHGHHQLPTTVTTRSEDEIQQSLSDLPISDSREEDEEHTLEEQQEAEGDILNEAISTMVDNYTNSASSAITNTLTTTAISIVERVTPSLIRAGTRLSSIASVGLLGMLSSSRMQPLNVMGRTIGGSRRRLGEDRIERYIVTGLVSTMVMGGISVGSAYATRFLTRRYIASKRSLENESIDNNDKKT